MKTQINLADYQFSGKNNPLFQISDSPVNKLVRVIEVNRAEFLLDIDLIPIHGITYYIDAILKIVVFSEPTKVMKEDWNIIKGDFTIKVDDNLVPVDNPDFIPELEVSPENYPYLLVDAYDQFKAIALRLNTPILELFIASNDSKQLFD